MSLRQTFFTLAVATLGLAGLPAAAGAASFNSITDAQVISTFKNTFTAEGRVDSNIISVGNFQLDLGASTANPQNKTNYSWQSGVAVPFTLDYNSLTKNVTFTVGTGGNQKILSYINTSSVPITDIDLRTVATNTALPNGSTILTPTSLIVNGANVTIPIGLNSTANASSQASNLDIGALTPNPSFTLTGNSVFTFTGAPPLLSDESFQISAGNFQIVVSNPTAVPEPVPMSLMSIGVGVLALYTLRRKQTLN